MPEAVNSETENTPVSPMLKINISEQIEYYFGDFNIMKDKFLKQEITKDDGWIAVNTLLRFNKLAALTKNIDVILSAFDDTPSSIVEINKETKCIRRNPDRPIPEPDDAWRASVAERSVYVKGFPLETTTLDDILKFMQTFGKIDNVFRRCYYDKALKIWKFKGSAYVAFPTREDAEKFMSIKSVKFAGNELIKKWQNDYIEDKKNERIQQKLKTKEMKNQLIQEQQDELKEQKLPTGALIHLTGLIDNIKINDLKKAVEVFSWDVAFVDYKPGDTEAYMRLQKQDSAKEAIDKLSNSSFEVNKTQIEAKVIEGEKESELLKQMEADKNTRVLQNLMRNKGGRAGKKAKAKRKGKLDYANFKKKNNIAKKDVKTEVSKEKNVEMEVVKESNSDNAKTNNVEIEDVKKNNSDNTKTNNVEIEDVKENNSDNTKTNHVEMEKVADEGKSENLSKLSEESLSSSLKRKPEENSNEAAKKPKADDD